ncbi:MAG: hypothetical protein GTO63_09855 [Anaerolineae bacterium]|nr:hypothetical protein [Anaerolineae bacterium]NIN95218.1 hypothetical protein [Anaerolineae bacterium]NIQ78188.1 hypothetical protein [Anaerolineae bacterium]
MSWRQHLDVMRGELRVATTLEAGTGTVEAVVKCREPLLKGEPQFLVGIRRVDHPTRLPSPEHSGPFKVLGVMIELAPRIPRRDRYGAQPGSFLHLVKRLMAPRRDEGEEALGYRVLAYLNLIEAKSETITITDVLHPDSPIEFAYLQEPYLILAHQQEFSYSSPDDVVKEFEDRWFRPAEE